VGIRRLASRSGTDYSGLVPSEAPTDPIDALLPRFRDAILRAFGPEHAATDPLLRRSDRADLQANLALGLGKKLGKPPRVVAEAIVSALAAEEILAKVEIAGPGFLNLTLRDEWLAAAVDRALGGERLGVPAAATTDEVVIDYSSPNVAKEMHVGHLRSTVIGDALARLLAFRGHRVIRQNHVGDWGTPFGMLIEHLVDLGEAGAKEVSIGELGAFYKQARAKFDGDPAFADRARRRVVALQSGDPETLRLWRTLFDASRVYFERIYALLDVTLTSDDIRGESFYDPMLAPLADELAAREIAKIDQGALCIFVPGFATKEGAPLPLIVRKSDGGFGYAATDLAAIRYRTSELRATRVLYVVGTPQEQHLSMVFGAARLAGFVPEGVRVQHVNFGSVLGTDKRMYKTRSGETVRLVDLIEEAIERAAAAVAAKASDLPEAERTAIARAVGVGAIKYADLSSDRVKDYVFDIDRMVSFEGNTAPYLQYAHARIRSIFRKAGIEHATAGAAPREPAERALALELLAFGATIRAVEETLEPHRLCGYLYGLAARFTEFYDACPVLKSEEPVRSSRLVLCDLTAKTLSLGLSLLGITALERM
jgi:arginyl-tRNA synthetase